MYCLFYVILQIGLILVPGVHFYDESEEKFNMEGNQCKFSFDEGFPSFFIFECVCALYRQYYMRPLAT